MALIRFQKPQPMTPQEMMQAGNQAGKAEESRNRAMQVYNLMRQQGYDENTVFYNPSTSPNDYNAVYVVNSLDDLTQTGFSPQDIKIKDAQDFAGVKDKIKGSFVPGIGPSSTFARAYNNSFVTAGGKTYAVNTREGFVPLQGELRNAGSIDVGTDAPAIERAIQATGVDNKQSVSQAQQTGIPTPGSNQAPPSTQQILDTVKQVVQNNPQILQGDITDQTISDVLAQAKTEVGPYFDQLYNQARYDLERGLGTISQNLATGERQLESQYGQQLNQLGESAAASGRAFSVGRQRNEGLLGQSTQDAIDAQRQQATQQATTMGLQAERQLGTTNLPVNFQSITDLPRPTISPNGQGVFARGSGSRSLYTPVGNTVGTLQQDRTFAEQSRAKELGNTSAERGLSNYLAYNNLADQTKKAGTNLLT